MTRFYVNSITQQVGFDGVVVTVELTSMRAKPLLAGMSGSSLIIGPLTLEGAAKFKMGAEFEVDLRAAGDPTPDIVGLPVVEQGGSGG